MRRSAIPALGLTAGLAMLVGIATATPPGTIGRARSVTGMPGRGGCTIAPRPTSDLFALGWTPALGLVVPSAKPLPNPWLDYDRFGPDNIVTTDEIWSVVRVAASCLALGDGPRFYALYTDDVLRSAFASTAEADAAHLAPRAMPDMPVGAGTWRISDDRVGAVFSTPQSMGLTADRGRPVWFTFQREHGRWLIDEAVPFAEGS